MVMLGFMFNYMLRVNLAMAIVEMVVDTNHAGAKNDSQPIQDALAALPPANGTTKPYQDSEGKFYWDKYDQNFVLGSFFWGYIVTEVPGGRMAEVIGSKLVFGGGMLMASIVTFLTPAACYLGIMPVVVVRALIGFFLGTFALSPSQGLI